MPPSWLEAHLQSSCREHLCLVPRFPARLLPRGGKGEQGMPVSVRLPSSHGGWTGRGRGISCCPASAAERASAQRLALHPVTQPPCPTQRSAARVVGVLTHAKFSGCPCDFLGFICASAGKFRARRTPPRHVSAAPAASSCPSHQSPLLSARCGADFFMFCCLERGKEQRLNGEEAKCGLKIVNEKM